MIEGTNPWMFHRDELDLLEDEIEDLQKKFPLEGDSASVESLVLQEQTDTEDASDAALSMKLGLTELDGVSLNSGDERIALEDAYMEISAGSEMFRKHPLYQRARHWSARVRVYAKHGYDQHAKYEQAFFRAYVNSHSVPVKVFTGLCEESFVDVVGLEVAEEEFQLALTYVGRILESLSIAVSSADDFDVLSKVHVEGEELRAILVGKIAEIRRRKQAL